MTIGYLLITLIIILFGLAVFILWILSIISVIKNDFINPTNKIVWIILLIFIPITCFIYPHYSKNQIIDKDEKDKENFIKVDNNSFKF
jgi:glucan phosphoethanolaminetransferase (alkaline phosphatase superfamily)